MDKRTTEKRKRNNRYIAINKPLSSQHCKGLPDWLYSMFILHHSWIDLYYIIWTAIMHLLLYRYSLLFHSPIIIVKFVTAPIGRCEHMDKRIVNLCESLWILVHRPPQWTLNSLDSRELGIAFTWSFEPDCESLRTVLSLSADSLVL